jgi:alanyl-tRNA synthetase
VLGEHVTQKGSLVDAQRLRFDFSHPEAMTQRRASGGRGHGQCADPRQHAGDHGADVHGRRPEAGAMALFGEKYGDEVRVLTMGSDRFSVELCGGTHVERTGDIGLLRISSEGGLASGVRRIEAVTGATALAAVRDAVDARWPRL